MRPSEPEAEAEGPLRRCFVSGEVRPKSELLRLVVAPDGRVVPDVAGRLPGRGLWLSARRDIVAAAVAKRLFARAARQPVTVEDGLADRVEALLAQRCRDDIGLARRAGRAVMGFTKVHAALAAGKVGVLLAAGDGAADGRGKLRALAPKLPLVDRLTSAELGAAFGREHVVHAAVAPGRLARALLADAERLAGFRPGAAELDGRNSAAAPPRPSRD
ncbi:MAG TPA: RNA-binding protein [Stellaceae bacterium]|nr:RNA-binding protein [Stellaceae bacterium]